MAQKHNVSVNTLIKRANSEKWAEQRNGVYKQVTAEIQQKTADIVSMNAVKMEQARAAAIDVIRAGLERLRTMQGSKVTTKQTDKNGKPVTVDFDLLSMVAAMEKLERMGGGNQGEEPVKVIIDV